MKKAIILSVIGLFFVSSVFALTNTKVKKDSPLINKGAYLAPQEKAPSLSNPNTGIENSFSFSNRDANAVLIDSSSNGYGMVVSSTRPIDNDEDNWIVVYRQYAGEGTTHGQLGGAFSEDGDDWEYDEGCLSIPEINELVKRKKNIEIQYLDENFNVVIEKISGIEARVIQHEYDHLRGIFFTDYLPANRKNILNRKLKDISKGKFEKRYNFVLSKKK